jgi:hypothetical protein
MVCAKLKPAVSGLEREFPGKVTARNVDASEPDARQEIRALGFRSHGIVIRSTDGTVLWKQADHSVQMDAVHGALSKILT